MVEYGDSVSRCDLAKQGDFIKALIDRWQVDEVNVRVGVVAYHDRIHNGVSIS